MSTGPIAERRLDDWREELSPLLEGWRAFALPADFPYDFSPASLAALEPVLLARHPEGSPPAPDAPFAAAAAGYLGEVLLRVGGGGWAWDAGSGTPYVRLDERLGLDPVRPLELLAAAARERSGTVLTGAVRPVEQAVARVQRADAGWRPAKEPTPGLDPVDLAALPQDPWLRGWLAERAAGFDAWRAAAGPGDWDFSPDTVDRLEAVLLDRFGSVEAFTAERSGDFLQGAAWYYGEIARRHRRAAWQYTPLDPASDDWLHSADNPWAGVPYVSQEGADGNVVAPISELRATVRRGTAGTLRQRFAQFTG